MPARLAAQRLALSAGAKRFARPEGAPAGPIDALEAPPSALGGAAPAPAHSLAHSFGQARRNVHPPFRSRPAYRAARGRGCTFCTFFIFFWRLRQGLEGREKDLTDKPATHHDSRGRACTGGVKGSRPEQCAECAQCAGSPSRGPVSRPGAKWRLHILATGTKECAKQCARRPQGARSASPRVRRSLGKKQSRFDLRA